MSSLARLFALEEGDVDAILARLPVCTRRLVQRGWREAADAKAAAAKNTAADKAVADKAVADKTVADKAVADKALADKAVAEKAVADKAVVNERPKVAADGTGLAGWPKRSSSSPDGTPTAAKKVLPLKGLSVL